METIKKLISNPQWEVVEFYESFPDTDEDLGKVISSFANTKGGYIIIGVKSEGKVILGYGSAFEKMKILDRTLDRLSPRPDWKKSRISVNGEPLLVLEIKKSNDEVRFDQTAYFRKGKKNVPNPEIHVFISYSHEEVSMKYLNENDRNSLISFIKKPLEKKGIVIWYDHELLIGDGWVEKIRERIEKSHIVLAFVTQPFLNSDFIQKEEIRTFLKKRKDDGLVVMPLMILPCHVDDDYQWLKDTNWYPSDGKYLEEFWDNPVERAEKFRHVLDQLIRQAELIRRRWLHD